MNQEYRTETPLMRASMLRVSKGITALFVCMTLLSGVFVVEAPTFTYSASTGSITQARSVAYAAPSKATKKKVAAQRKAMKKTVAKTKAIATKYPDAKKYYTAANKAYKKSAKAKTVASAKKYRATVNKNYKKALGIKKSADAYKKSIKDTYNNTVAVAKQAPSLAKYVDASKAQYVRSTKAVKISELKTLKASVVSYYNSAKSAKAKLTWSDAMYEDRFVAEKVVEHPAVFINSPSAAYCVYCLNHNGGFMYADDHGLFWYTDPTTGKQIDVGYRGLRNGDDGPGSKGYYSNYTHTDWHADQYGISGVHFYKGYPIKICTARVYTETIPAHTERILIRAAGWY